MDADSIGRLPIDPVRLAEANASGKALADLLVAFANRLIDLGVLPRLPGVGHQIMAEQAEKVAREYQPLVSIHPATQPWEAEDA